MSDPRRAGATLGGHLRRAALPVFLVLVASTAPLPASQEAGPWDGDFFARGVAGTWHGTGVVYGNPVTLTREWTLDLAGQFLRADMHVEMGGGFGFRALAYWSLSGPGTYRVVWMDEIGVTQEVEALGDPEARTVTTLYLETDADENPGWRRIVYRLDGPDRYVETMHVLEGDEWRQVAEFVFERDGGGQ